MRRILGAAGAALLAGGLATTAMAGEGTPVDRSANPLTLAVYGDAPYGTSNADTAEFQATPAFIDSINGDPKVRLVVHVGDIHSGKQTCSRDYDQSVYDLWTRFTDPLVYTPGDNEWTDCQKAAEGGGNPVENLAIVRSIFFANPGHTLGGRDQRVAFQDAYPENVMWQQSRTVFVTLNVPGGSNDDADPWFGQPETQAQHDERTQREAADLRWLDEAFARAADDDVRSVVIALQADMWDLDGKTAAHLSNYEPLIAEMARLTKAFGRPVLLLNGDSHTYRSDNPLQQGAPCETEGGPCADDDWSQHPHYDVANFHRIVVHGSTFPLEWLKLTIDPRAGQPFSWQRMTQPQP